MSQTLFHLFETAIGRCAVLWRGDAITGVLLPADGDDALLLAIGGRAKDALEGQPPVVIKAVISNIIKLCAGEPVSFDAAPLDRSAIEPFANSVYDLLRRVPFGETTTYGAIAEALGDKSLARAVGAALGQNPFPIVIPCHRVIASHNGIGGFSAPGGAATKRRLLDIEGAFAAEKLPLFGA